MSAPVSISDIGPLDRYVCYTFNSRHLRTVLAGRLRAMSCRLHCGRRHYVQCSAAHGELGWDVRRGSDSEVKATGPGLPLRADVTELLGQVSSANNW